MEKENLQIKENVMQTVTDICLNSPIFVEKINITKNKIKIILCKLDTMNYNQSIECECDIKDWNSDTLKQAANEAFYIKAKEQEQKKSIIKRIKSILKWN